MRLPKIPRGGRRWLLLATLVLAAARLPAEVFDFASPTNLTGTIYQLGSQRQKVLFTFQRTARREGDTVRVVRKYFSPAGAAAAVENITYQSGQLADYRMQEFQAGVSARIAVTNDPQHAGSPAMAISCAPGPAPPPGRWQKMPPDTLIDDNVYAFLLAHWDALQRGEPVKFRFVALEPGKTVGFRFIKTGEAVAAGRPVVMLKMEPTNFIIAQFVEPLVFTVETAAPHRVLSYTGGTTPRVKKGRKWKYLDAETVFDWK